MSSWGGLIWSAIGIFFGSATVGAFVALAVVDRVLVRRLKSNDNSDSVDGIVVGAITRREAELAVLVNRITAHRFADLDAKWVVAQTNHDRLETVESIQELSITRIAKLETETRDMPRMVDALERIERAMEGIAKGMNDTRDLVHTMKGEWNAEMRRRSTDR